MSDDGSFTMEEPPTFDPDMYPRGINADFKSAPGVEDRDIVKAFHDRFENPETREIAGCQQALMALFVQHGLSSGSLIVDIGMGTGLFMQPLSSAVGPTGKVIGTEVSSVFEKHLLSRCVSDGLSNVQVILNADGRSLGLDASYYQQVDLVTVLDVYHHLEYPITLMRKVRKALKPDGRMIVVDFIRDANVHKSHADPEWIMKHVRANKDTFVREIQSGGFKLIDEPVLPGLSENYVLVFAPISAEQETEVGAGWGMRK